MLILTSDVKKFFRDRNSKPTSGPSENCYWAPGGDHHVMDVDVYLSTEGTLDLDNVASNKEHRRYLEYEITAEGSFKITAEGSVFCEIGNRGGHPLGALLVEEDVWEKVKEAYSKAGYEVSEMK